MEENQEKANYSSYKKVLLFGDESTGKSSLSRRLITNKFKEDIIHTENG